MLRLFTIHNKQEEKQVMDHLNKWANQVYEAEKARVLSLLENDLQKAIYLDWWYGGSLWLWNEEKRNHDRAKRYQHVNDHDWDNAHGYIMETNGYIMETINNGMG
jgi:hypothetical protein